MRLREICTTQAGSSRSHSNKDGALALWRGGVLASRAAGALTNEAAAR